MATTNLAPAFSATNQPQGVGQKPGGTRRTATSVGVALCREKEILPKMADVALTLYGMLVMRQKEAELRGPTGKLEFARDESNVRLAGAAIEALGKVAEFGHAKMRRIEHFGDLPNAGGTTVVENKVIVALKIGDGQPQVINGKANGNGHYAVTVPSQAEPVNGD